MGLAAKIEPRTVAPAFLAAVADDVTRETVRQVAAQFGWPQGRVREGGVAAMRDLLAASAAPGLLLVDVSDSDDPLAAMDGLAEVCDPQTRVVALGQTNDVALYRGLLQLGVSDYLVKPVSAEILADALRRAQRSGEEAAAADKPTRTVAVVGARGGVGATSVATSIAWGLAHERGRRTVLLDLDLQFGSAALSLDLEPARGLREILTNPERIDSLLVSSAMVQESENLRLMGAEEPLEDEVALDPAGLTALAAALAESCDILVIDVPRRADRMTRDVLARADVVVVVTDLTLPAMRDSQRLIRFLSGLRSEGGVVLMANAVGRSGGEAPKAEFEKAVGTSIAFTLPSDPKAAEAAAEQAKPLVSTARATPLGAELRRLMDHVAGTTETADIEPRKASWLERVLKR